MNLSTYIDALSFNNLNFTKLIPLLHAYPIVKLKLMELRTDKIIFFFRPLCCPSFDIFKLSYTEISTMSDSIVHKCKSTNVPPCSERVNIDTCDQIHDRSFPGLEQALQLKVAELNSFYGPKLPLLVKWCGHASALHMWVKWKPSHTFWRTVLLYITL